MVKRTLQATGATQTHISIPLRFSDICTPFLFWAGILASNTRYSHLNQVPQCTANEAKQGANIPVR